MGDPLPPAPEPAKPWAQYLLQPHNPHPSPLSGTQDLISLFHLSPLYDTFLRPYLPANLAPTGSTEGGGGAEADGAGGGGAVKGQVLLGKAAAQLAAQGGQLKASPASPMPSTAAAAPTEVKAGLKITLGGIKLAGTTLASAPSSAADDAGAGGSGKKPKRPKMDKTYDYMVGDVLGRISQPHPSATASSSLLHLISNPDPAPCPPIHALDPTQLREAFTLKQGGLSGFDMSLWEGRGGAGEKGGGGTGGGGHKKKRKRKHDDPNSSSAAAAAGDAHKKQKR